ncbi:pfs domain-containing protein [Colletotrichum asianum]|uniref:Pfs domain-containing protein n=1 Tax=Colletotrichum asianum TaxID=702518 RepID=A0A8H3WQE4_9PEZI|nr:pfs domain-containing protein [Colletotrichum asianum]
MSISSSSPPKSHENPKESMVAPGDVVLSEEPHARLFNHVLNGDTRGVIELLDGQAETSDLRRLCRTALLAAVQQGHLEIMTEALKRVVTCVEESEIGGIYADALQDAAWRGHIDIVTTLIDEGADVNAEGGQHETALHAASSRGWREVAAILLAKGARTDKQDPYGFYPLQLAIQNGHQEIANDLLPKCTNILASIKASEWRDCYGDGNNDLELYFDPMPAIRKLSIKSLYARNYPLGLEASNTNFMSESRQNFMEDDIKSKRVL